jgi:hypothetical protein
LAILADPLSSFIKSTWCIDYNNSSPFNPFGWIIDLDGSKSNGTSIHISNGLSSTSYIFHSSLTTSLWINFSFYHLIWCPLAGLTSVFGSSSTNMLISGIFVLYLLMVTQTSTVASPIRPWPHSLQLSVWNSSILP